MSVDIWEPMLPLSMGASRMKMLGELVMRSAPVLSIWRPQSSEFDTFWKTRGTLKVAPGAMYTVSPDRIKSSPLVRLVAAVLLLSPGLKYTTFASFGSGTSVSIGLTSRCNTSQMLPLTCTTTFLGPSREKVILFPLTWGLMLNDLGHISTQLIGLLFNVNEMLIDLQKSKYATEVL